MKQTVTILMVLVLVAVAGCGGDDGPTNPGGGAGGLTAAQTTLISTAGSAPFLTNSLVESAVTNVAHAVEAATVASGGTELKLTGTLTQSAPNSSSFTWTAQPTDHMVVVLSGGPTFAVTIGAMQGFLDGTADDFLKSHTSFIFNVSSPNLLSLQVVSQAGPPPSAGFQLASGTPQATAATTVYSRRATGTVVSGGKTLTVDITNTGGEFFEIDGTFVELRTEDNLTGTIHNGDGHIVVHETDSSHSIFNSAENIRPVTFHNFGSSRATLGSDVFEFHEVSIAREFTNDRIAQPDFWQVTGQLLKNGAVIGNVDWSKPPIEGTPSANQPHPVVKLTVGGSIDIS